MTARTPAPSSFPHLERLSVECQRIEAQRKSAYEIAGLEWPSGKVIGERDG